PRAQLAVDVARELLALLGEPRDLVGNVDRGVLVHVAQLVDLLLQLGDRLLEIEERLLDRHAQILAPRRRYAKSTSASRPIADAIAAKSSRGTRARPKRNAAPQLALLR